MRCTLPRLVRKNSKLSLWSLFIKGMMVQLGFTPRFRTAYTYKGELGSDPFRATLAFTSDWQADVPHPRRTSAHLQQCMGCNLQHHGVLGDVPQCFLEEHRAHQVVDVVLSRRCAGQAALPLGLRDRGAEPAC